jgi:hypothetical protein
MVQSVWEREYKLLDVSMEERGEPANVNEHSTTLHSNNSRMRLEYVLAKKGTLM